MPHYFIDAEISVTGLKGPADEQALSFTLSGLDGIQKLSVSEGKVALEYDPVRITRAELSKAISRAGFRVAEIESGSASSITDALHGKERGQWGLRGRPCGPREDAGGPLGEAAVVVGGLLLMK